MPSYGVERCCDADDENATEIKLVHDPDECVELLGWGRFHNLLFAFVGLVVTSEYILVMVMSFQLPVLEKEWGLSKATLGTCGSMLFVGMLLGAGIWSKLADRLGRRFVLRWAIVLGLLFSLLDVAAPNVVVLGVGKLGIGFCSTGAFTAAYTLLSEVTPLRLRTRVMLLVKLFFSLGSALAALCAKLVLGTGVSWRLYLGVCLMPQLVALLLHWKVPESLRFLCATGRFEPVNVSHAYSPRFDELQLQSLSLY